MSLADRVRWQPPPEGQRFVVHGQVGHGLELDPVDGEEFPLPSRELPMLTTADDAGNSRPRQLLFRDDTKPDQPIVSTITDRKHSHDAHPTTL
jgi:hypothetical protein